MLVTITSIALILSVAVPLAAYLKMGKKHGKGLLAANVISFFSVVLVATVCAFSPSPVFADAAPAAAAGGRQRNGVPCGRFGYGTRLYWRGYRGCSSGASAALGAISENDKIMGKGAYLRCACRRYRALWPARYVYDSRPDLGGRTYEDVCHQRQCRYAHRDAPCRN